jgi:hypothetical protein
MDFWLGGDVKTAQPQAAAPTVLAEMVRWEQHAADHAGSAQQAKERSSLRTSADRSALVIIVSAEIQGPGCAVSAPSGAFQCVIGNVESQNILVGADIIRAVHEPNLHT